MRGSRLWLSLAAVALVVLIFAIYWRQPRSLAIVHPQRGAAVEAIYATGTVEPVRWAEIAPTVAGCILGLEAEEGDMVEAGTVLIRLDDRAAQAELVEREADARFLKSEVDRLSTLVRRETASRQSYDRAISELDQARASAEAARKRLSDFTIVAPFPARVLRKEGEIGEVVQPGTVLFWLGTPAPWRVTVEVDEEDIPRVAQGQRALVKADAFPGQYVVGFVGEITPQGDPVNKSYRVRIALPKDAPLRVGMTVEVNVVTRESQQALLVPVDAVSDGAVWVIEDGRAKRRPVESGIRSNDRIEIRSGLNETETVIATPPANLREGEAVRSAGS